MAETEYTVIELPEWGGKWRIAGSELDWQIQVPRSRGKQGVRWEGANYFPHLSDALAKAYERTLRETGKRFTDISDVAEECRRVKRELERAVGA